MNMKNRSPDIKWIINDLKPGRCSERDVSGLIARIARRISTARSRAADLPLRSLPNLAQKFGIGGIWVKDEAARLELNSFKVLGGSFAIYRFMQERLGLKDEVMSYEYLTSPEVKSKLGEVTFASATDGNHGKSIAWAASKLGHKSVIYVHPLATRRALTPSGTSAPRSR